MDDPERAVHVPGEVAGEDDLVAPRRPVAGAAEQRAGRRDLLEAGAVDIDHEQTNGIAVLVGAAEDKALAVGRVVARRVTAAWVRGDPDQAAPVGGADRVDPVSARVGRLVPLVAGETLVVR